MNLFIPRYYWQRTFGWLGQVPSAFANLGWSNALTYHRHLFARLLLRRALKPLVQLHSKLSTFPLWCRTNSSDLDVFRQIFVDREYKCIDDVAEASVIVDCGANVGYSSAYFLSRFPHAKVIAVEPDPGNFEVLLKNVEQFGSRITPVCAAIWSQPGSLALSDDTYRDGREWSRQVKETNEIAKATVAAIDIPLVMAMAQADHISILKIDIERAERVVFAGNCQSWLSKVDTIVIELHDRECEEIFFDAISHQHFSVSRHGELTICRRRRE